MDIKFSRKLYLDGWRGISIILVLIGHFAPLPEIQWGILGVGFFFALSGRLMGEIVFIQKFPVVPFLIRRFSRVWPGLLVFVGVMLIFSRLTSVLGSPLSISSAVTALTFTYGYARIFGAGWHAIEHVWSLCIEEHSYLVLLCVAGLTARDVKKASWALLGITILSIGDGLVRALLLGQDYFNSYWFTDASLHFITVPALIYLWKDRITPYIRRINGYASAILIVAGIILYYHRVPFYVTATFAPFILGGAVVMLPHAKRPLIAILENKVLTTMGTWSYSIYIWQQPFMAASSSDARIVRIGFMAMAIATGMVSFYMIERPARSFINSQLASRRGNQSTSARSPERSAPLRT